MSARRRSFAALVACALFFGALTAHAVPVADLMARARDAAAHQRWNDSARALEEIVAAGYDSTGVLYDLGTAYAQAGRYGEAIWRLEQVNRRSVFAGDAQHNLRAARLRLAHRDAGRTGRAVVETAVPWSVAFAELLPLDWSVALTLGCEIAALAFLLSWRRRRAGEIARVGSAAGVILLSGAAVFFGAIVIARHLDPRAGIVLHDGLRLLREPTADAIGENPVREGERVDIVSRNGAFVRVRGNEGHQGWLPSRDVGSLDE